MATLILTGLITVLGAAWFLHLRARERAVAVATNTCRRRDVQLLDGTVALQRVALIRTDSGSLGLRRTFRFEYSDDGVTRRWGTVVMNGSRPESVVLAGEAGNAD